MIDLVFWSFAVAVLPMLLALGGSMIASAAGVLARPAPPTNAWGRPDRCHFRPTQPHAFAAARLDRSGSRSYDF